MSSLPYIRNRLLAALPQPDYQRLSPHLEPVTLTTKQLIGIEYEPIEHAYFPLDCMISMLARTGEDTFVEVATVGRDGMFGIPLLLGTDSLPFRAFMQIPGQALRLRADVFRDEIRRGGPLVSILNRYVQMLSVQMGQGGACNGYHTAEQRCARWLLMTRDRIDGNRFAFTHEFLCQMLGVRRATVSEIAARFQSAGLIHYSRGKITIDDPEGLERNSCQCYRIIKASYDEPLIPSERGEASVSVYTD
ncbi:MAG TPA: Crp/Fnr family transcriptional regulator [Bryobacteraceae bacterium]|jgi:CRP-like cAMP-binding protein|nr:Crp/Fnr family transcriptional regulator [Bryobacteraceae bacterium]